MTPAEQASRDKPRRRCDRPVMWKTDIARRRKSLDLTMADVERRVGLSSPTVARAESGFGVSLETAWKLAEFFGCKIEDLFTPNWETPDANV